MKKLLAILILIFTLQIPSWADDIRDFQIEGMSIGDSALDFFTKEDIIKNSKSHYKDKKFTPVVNNNYPFFKTYYAVDFNFKTGDSKYILHGVSGIIDYRDKSMSKCKKQLKEIYNDFSRILPNWRKISISTHSLASDPSGKSTDTWAGFFSNSGDSITIGCIDYSAETLPNKMDHLDVTIRTDEFNKFLKTAYD